MKQNRISRSVLTVTAAGLSAALLTVCSWISIPVEIPYTLQTFAVFLISCLFSLKIGLASLGVYIALGVVGIPVFAGFKSGAAVIMGPTGGYIVGFFFIVIAVRLFSMIKPRSFFVNLIGMTVGLAVCYTFGSLWFYFVFLNTDKQMTLLAVMQVCVLPYLIPDAVKMVLAAAAAGRLYRPMSKLGFTPQA